MKYFLTAFGLLCIVRNCICLEYNKQNRVNANTDFLMHEAGSNPANTRKDISVQPTSSTTNLPNNQNQGKRDYIAQFPALKPTHNNVNLNNNPGQQTSASTNTAHTTPRIQQINNNGKRDYVAPQYPALKPAQGNLQPGGVKVKDLINFYDGKSKDQNSPQGLSSYSSILQGSTKKNALDPTTKTTQTFIHSPTPTPTTKPMSFSSIVAGPNKPNTQFTTTTLKQPNSPTVTASPASGNSPSRPGSPVLPSTIVNNNRNNNQGTNSNNKATDAELEALGAELLRKDINNAARYITINYQGKTTSQSNEDKALQPLLSISPEAWNITTIQKILPLLDNYERDTLVNEYVTPQERNEENAFMDAIMATSVIRHLMNFLKDKGYVSPDPRQQREFLKQLWFSLYSRGKGKISSSGFEHVFVSELKNGEVSGLHNWIYFSKEESANRINYLGYLKYIQLNEKGAILKTHFSQQGVNKPVNSMFIGTSPELEIALYTLCFVTRADNDCNLKLANNDVNIITYTFRYRSKNLIGSAFPQI